jgi:hypothetical protein
MNKIDACVEYKFAYSNEGDVIMYKMYCVSRHFDIYVFLKLKLALVNLLKLNMASIYLNS